MKNKTWLGNFLLLLAAIIWGCAYIAQSKGMDYIGPITFNSIRCLIAGIVPIPFCIVKDKLNIKNSDKESKNDKSILIKGGLCCGIVLSFASMSQQIGISKTTVGKAGFLSVMYIFIVPFIQILFHKKLPKGIWISISVAIIGMYFLCINEGFTIETGDLVCLLASFFYAIHILVISYFAPKTDTLKLSSVQFLCSFLFNSILMFIFENPSIKDILAAWFPLLYAGAISGGVAYTLQIIGQKYADPSIASLILSLESVISAIAGVIFLNQIPTIRQTIGCVLMFAAIILVQLLNKSKREKAEQEIKV